MKSLNKYIFYIHKIVKSAWKIDSHGFFVSAYKTSVFFYVHQNCLHEWTQGFSSIQSALICRNVFLYSVWIYFLHSINIVYTSFFLHVRIVFFLGFLIFCFDIISSEEFIFSRLQKMFCSFLGHHITILLFLSRIFSSEF